MEQNARLVLKISPEGLQTLRGMNATGEIHDDSMCSLAVSVFSEAQRTGCLKWPELQTCLQILAPRERSQRFAACNPPDLGTKQKVWFVTDSILNWKKDTEGLGTKARKRKPERSFPEIWAANKHMWGPHNIEAKFSIHGSDKITQLINGFKKML